MLPPLHIRVDASPQMGVGHAIRCITLARAWQSRGGAVALYMHDTVPLVEEIAAASEVGIHRLKTGEAKEFGDILRQDATPYVVIDGYHFTTDYETTLRQQQPAILLAVIDDRFRETNADVFINLHPAERGSFEDCNARLLAQGSSFALIRPEITSIQRESRETASRLLIAFGGTDVAGLGEKTLDYLRANPPENFSVRLIKAGAKESFKNVDVQSSDWKIAPHLEWADAILCTPSTIALEAACSGLPVFTVTVAENQLGIAEAIEKNRTGHSLGDAGAYDPAETLSIIGKIFQDPAALTRMGKAGHRWINGQGAERIVNALTAINFHFRQATTSDSELIWKWANDPVVRSSSFQSRAILWETHSEWYEKKLASQACAFHIAETIDGKPFAICRFEQDPVLLTCLISFSLDSAYRGLGLGTLLLSSACKTYSAMHPEYSIQAQIKPGNAASISVFEHAGFRKMEEAADHLTLSYVS
ncbi:MAG: GNAT family N-acetyltransferase [Chthoniobacterales bacterium]